MLDRRFLGLMVRDYSDGRDRGGDKFPFVLGTLRGGEGAAFLGLPADRPGVDFKVAIAGEDWYSFRS